MANVVGNVRDVNTYPVVPGLRMVSVSVMGKVFVSEEEKLIYSSAGAGFIGQNVYLFCASEGLATVIRGLVDKDALAKDLNLKKNQKIILAQTVGYPKEEK